ncbi:MAG TPA: metallopeptidase TldD-related protein [Alphaproteobacteria bacterium]|nr:metallopeptidase TldD-related protein [Alphaproteobacteria bacterium]
MATILDSDLDFLTDLIGRARRAGADAADAVMVEGTSISHARRLGKLEKLERSEGQDLGLRVFVGKRQAIVSSSDRSLKAVEELVPRAVAMAKAAPEDPFCGIADPAELAKNLLDLDLIDPVEPSAETLVERARGCEETAMAVPGITNSEGAEAGWGRTRVALAASNGFVASYARSSHSVSVAVLAGTGTSMERDYDYSSTLHGSDLESPETVGRRAAERTLRRLNPRKIATCKCPIVYDRRVSGGLLRHLAGAINGAAIARGTSFLKSKMGQLLFPEAITIIDDPFRKRGLSSKPVDGEGIAPMRRAIIDNGVLTTWLLDLRSARQLNLKSTGHASRGTTSPPGPSATNLYMENGKISRDALIGSINDGIYVTEFIGMGVNNVTGDYSRGAAGFRIENGKLTYPVSEITVAGNLLEMFQRITAADDLEFRYGVDAPTVMIDAMTVAGL